MNKHTIAIRAALSNAISGEPMPSFQSAEAHQMLQTIRDFMDSTDACEKAQLGCYALKLMVKQLQISAAAERDSAILIDKFRPI